MKKNKSGGYNREFNVVFVLFLILIFILIISLGILNNAKREFLDLTSFNSDLKNEVLEIKQYRLSDSFAEIIVVNNGFMAATIKEFKFEDNSSFICNPKNTYPALPYELKSQNTVYLKCTAINKIDYYRSSKIPLKIALSYRLENENYDRIAGNSGLY